MNAVTAEVHRFTVDDVRAMIAAGVLDEDERVELIGGVLLDQSKDDEAHLRAKSALNSWLARKLDVRWGIASGTLHLSKEDAPEPDFYVYDQGSKLEPVDPAKVRLVIEVASTSHERDLKLKPSLYAAYSIADYWVVDLPAGVTHVHARPVEGRYAEVTRLPFEAPLEHAVFDGEPLTVAALPFFRPVG